MQPQEPETRLDFLLEKGVTSCLISLAEHVAGIHNEKVFDLSPYGKCTMGSLRLSHEKTRT